ncbi:MAG: glycosyltransferase [Planctomycetota bacterium]
MRRSSCREAIIDAHIVSEGARDMKVLQVVPTLSAGGTEGFVTNLGVHLAARGTDVRFFLLAGARGNRGKVLLGRLHDAGIQVIGARERNIRSPRTVLQLAWLIRSWRPDVLQANLYSAEVVCAAAKLLTLGRTPLFARRLANTELVGRRSRRVVRLMDRLFPLTVACSPAVCEAYRAFMDGTPASTLVVLPNGGLLKECVTNEQEKNRARRRLGIANGAFVTAHIGGYRMATAGRHLANGQKAHDILLKAFARAFGGDPVQNLLLVGDGPARPEAEALARELGIAEQTRFLGLQPEPWPALMASNVFCFPSRHEGLPNVLPEAASCGLPVVASHIPEIADISPGDAWLLEPVDDVAAFARGLRAVFEQNDIYRERAIRAAPAIRQRFSMDRCAERYREAYDRAIATSRGWRPEHA